MLETLLYLWMMYTNILPVVALQSLASSHGRWLWKLTIAISAVVLPSVHDGLLLLHIVHKYKWLYILTVGAEHRKAQKWVSDWRKLFYQ